MKKFLKNTGQIFLDFIEITIICVIIFAFTYYFIGQLMVVTGDSMHPTLKNGEQLLADKASLKFQKAGKGEIVVFEHPNNPNRLLIKRLVAMEGDKVRISNGDLLINGQLMEEIYLEKTHSTLGGLKIGQNNEYVVPRGEVMLLGDNRENSSDSRDFGFVKTDKIVGRAFLVYYPINSIRLIQQSKR